MLFLRFKIPPTLIILITQKRQGLEYYRDLQASIKKTLLLAASICIRLWPLIPTGFHWGFLDLKITAREALSKEKIEIKKRSHNIALPIEEKESIRWP